MNKRKARRQRRLEARADEAWVRLRPTAPEPEATRRAWLGRWLVATGPAGPAVTVK